MKKTGRKESIDLPIAIVSVKPSKREGNGAPCIHLDLKSFVRKSNETQKETAKETLDRINQMTISMKKPKEDFHDESETNEIIVTEVESEELSELGPVDKKQNQFTIEVPGSPSFLREGDSSSINIPISHSKSQIPFNSFQLAHRRVSQSPRPPALNQELSQIESLPLLFFRKIITQSRPGKPRISPIHSFTLAFGESFFVIRDHQKILSTIKFEEIERGTVDLSKCLLGFKTKKDGAFFEFFFENERPDSRKTFVQNVEQIERKTSVPFFQREKEEKPKVQRIEKIGLGFTWRNQETIKLPPFKIQSATIQILNKNESLDETSFLSENIWDEPSEKTGKKGKGTPLAFLKNKKADSGLGKVEGKPVKRTILKRRKPENENEEQRSTWGTTSLSESTKRQLDFHEDDEPRGGLAKIMKQLAREKRHLEEELRDESIYDQTIREINKERSEIVEGVSDSSLSVEQTESSSTQGDQKEPAPKRKHALSSSSSSSKGEQSQESSKNQREPSVILKLKKKEEEKSEFQESILKMIENMQTSFIEIDQKTKGDSGKNPEKAMTSFNEIMNQSIMMRKEERRIRTKGRGELKREETAVENETKRKNIQSNGNFRMKNSNETSRASAREEKENRNIENIGQKKRKEKKSDGLGIQDMEESVLMECVRTPSRNTKEKRRINSIETKKYEPLSSIRGKKKGVLEISGVSALLNNTRAPESDSHFSFELESEKNYSQEEEEATQKTSKGLQDSSSTKSKEDLDQKIKRRFSESNFDFLDETEFNRLQNMFFDFKAILTTGVIVTKYGQKSSSVPSERLVSFDPGLTSLVWTSPEKPKEIKKTFPVNGLLKLIIGKETTNFRKYHQADPRMSFSFILPTRTIDLECHSPSDFQRFVSACRFLKEWKSLSADCSSLFFISREELDYKNYSAELRLNAFPN